MNPRILYHKVVMFRASSISKSEVSITVAMFTPLYSSMNQELFEKYVYNHSNRNAEIRWCCTPQLSSETEVSISLLCQVFSTHFTAVQIKNCLKSTSAIKVATMKNTDDFRYAFKGSHHMQPPN